MEENEIRGHGGMADTPGVVQLAETVDLKSIQYEFESHLPDQLQLIERLLKKGKINEHCFIWIGAIRGVTNYGCIKYEKRVWDVHRLVGHFMFGPLTREDYICHKDICSFRGCFRPTHLYKGDASSNALDAIKKGTHNILQIKGTGRRRNY